MPAPSALRRRLMLLRLLPRVGPGLLTLAVGLLLVQALLPAFTALAAMALVQRVLADVGEVAALLPLILVMLGSQMIEQCVDPVRYAVIRRIDGAHRREVAAAACAPDGIAHLESAEYQDDLRRAAGEPDNWTEGTPGAAAWAQVYLLSGYLGLGFSAAVIARDAPWLAVGLLVVLLLYRAAQRRELLRPVRAWVAGLPDRRRAEYWTSVLTEPGNAKEMRVFGLAGWAGRHHRAYAEAHLRPFRLAKMAKLRRQWLWFLVIVTVGTGSLYVLGAMAAQGEISIARLAGNLAAVAGMLGHAAVSSEMLDLAAGQPPLLALERLRRWTPPTISAGSKPLPAGTPLLRFEDVRFGYAGGAAVLNGLNLEVRPGEVLALVGLNGAGKTTIIKLLARLYEPDSGRITVEGTDLREFDTAAWRSRLAVVFQDFLRYQLSAADNISLHPVPADELRAAAADAGADKVIDNLPDGYDTPLSPGRTGGVDLSGGQWQRVALARALHAMRGGARLLVLDEPTAHLDVRTEFEVFRQVVSAARDASVVLISHRLSTVREADRIVLLADGVVAESGTHDELMALGGRYAEMFQLQAQRFTEVVG